MSCSPPGSSVPGILQARKPELVAIPFFRGSAQLRDRTWVSCIAGRFFNHLSHLGSPFPPQKCPKIWLCSPTVSIKLFQGFKDLSPSHVQWVWIRTYLLASPTWTLESMYWVWTPSPAWLLLFALFSKEDLSQLKTSTLTALGWWILTSVSTLSLSPELQSAPAGYRTFLRGCSTVNSN